MGIWLVLRGPHLVEGSRRVNVSRSKPSSSSSSEAAGRWRADPRSGRLAAGMQWKIRLVTTDTFRRHCESKGSTQCIQAMEAQLKESTKPIQAVDSELKESIERAEAWQNCHRHVLGPTTLLRKGSVVSFSTSPIDKRSTQPHQCCRFIHYLSQNYQTFLIHSLGSTGY